jgi:hypothetical protein
MNTGGAMTRPAIQIEQPLFDYREMAADDRGYVKERALRIRDAAKRTAEGIIRIGQWLTEAKARLKHGQWLPWLESEFGWSQKTAWNFMQVYESIKLETVTNLPIDVSALYLIAAPKTPEPVRQEIIKRAEAGESMTRAKAVEVFEEYKAINSYKATNESPETPLYNAAIRAVDQYRQHDAQWMDTATSDDLEALVRIATDHEPERMLIVIRERAERNVRRLLKDNS